MIVSKVLLHLFLVLVLVHATSSQLIGWRYMGMYNPYRWGMWGGYPGMGMGMGMGMPWGMYGK
ncbi:hypothetical protein ANCCEY_08933 [Ancylostoma ceylanicum]|uniref:Neuropeptide-like protein 28 family protein n=1 Tax=Ancylostoma ceylanicum TaxID=53326 RepID=A0A0D6LWH7_9BILA|nr:hypothetical protein ANCCEY_08933 [Ancylostoma ceylanicum]